MPLPGRRTGLQGPGPSPLPPHWVNAVPEGKTQRRKCRRLWFSGSPCRARGLPGARLLELRSSFSYASTVYLPGWPPKCRGRFSRCCPRAFKRRPSLALLRKRGRRPWNGTGKMDGRRLVSTPTMQGNDRADQRTDVISNGYYSPGEGRKEKWLLRKVWAAPRKVSRSVGPREAHDGPHLLPDGAQWPASGSGMARRACCRWHATWGLTDWAARRRPRCQRGRTSCTSWRPAPRRRP